MATQEDRLKIQELVKRLHQARGNPEVEALLQVLAFRLQEIKDKLVECPPDKVPALQGEARGYSSLFNSISKGISELPRNIP